MQMQLFGFDVIFSSSRVLVSDNCKQSITVRLLLFGNLYSPHNSDSSSDKIDTKLF